MAETILNGNLAERRWLSDEYVTPYLRQSGFDRYMGSGTDAIIRLLRGTDIGNGAKSVVMPLVGLLRGDGVSGSQVLEGNEEDMDTYADEIRVTYRRNGVKVPKSESYKTTLDLLRVARPRLRDWAANKVLKKGLIQQMQGIVVPGIAVTESDGSTYQGPDSVVPYAQATAGQRNTFVTNNSDRILFGADIANASSGVMATALATIDSTNDKLTAAAISKVKRIAQATATIDATSANNISPITPYSTREGDEMYVYFAHPLSFRDLRNDPAMVDALKHAEVRGKDNPLFRAGDLMWDGVVIREMHDMEVIAGAGASGIDVAHNFLAGQSALAVAYGEEPRIITDRDQDYQFRPAVAVQELIGIKKTSFAGRQYGGVSHFVSATPDA